MSTRSVIATTNGTAYTGVYCHFDGYPTRQVPQLAAILTRDGAPARERLTANAWDSIAADTLPMDAPLPYPTEAEYREAVAPEDRDYAIIALYREHEDYKGKHAEQIIPGYGTAIPAGSMRGYSGTVPYFAESMAEWAYVIDADLTVTVYELEGFAGEGTVRATFTAQDLAAVAAQDPEALSQLQAVECGEDYERCSHCAWVHDDTVPDESRQLSMAQWLGREPIPFHAAVSGTRNGEHYQFGGGGMCQDGKWSLCAKGSREYVPVCTVDKNGVQRRLPGMVLTFPPTKAEVLAGAGK